MNVLIVEDDKSLACLLQQAAQEAYQLGADEKEAELTAFVHAQSFPPERAHLPGLYATYKHGVGIRTSGDFYTVFETARGPMVDYDALYEALASGQLGGAMLDTFAVEPVPPDWPLLRLPNITLTPHIAGASVRTVTIAAEQAAEEVRRFLAGEPPLNPC